MSIEAELTVTVAAVEVGDDYRVALTTYRTRTDYSPDEALQLADELVRAAVDARRMFAVDYPVVEEQHGQRPAHIFDLAPVCRECAEGKHGACTGIALVDGDDVEEHPCGCSRVDHLVIGGAA